MKHTTNGHMTSNEYFVMYMSSWKRVAVVLLFIWVVVTYLVLSPLRCNVSSEDSVDLQEQLRKVSTQLEALKKKHSRLLLRFNDGNPSDIDPGSLPLDTQGPPKEYEELRRRVYTNTKELWYYLNHELSALMQGGASEKIQEVLSDTAERKRSLLSDMEKLPLLDGYHEWRESEAANVSDLVQRRLHYLQNPADCRAARKVICNLNKGCGFGCQVHHLIYCLIFAYATERTLIVNSKGWRYNTKGWDYIFYPISDTCTVAYDEKVYLWPESVEAKVISLPYIDSMSRKPKFLPLTVPKDLVYRVMRFNGDPASWWIGQVLKFILKPRPEMQKAINETIEKMNFKKPIVGIHIRRTDKVGAEAAFHHIHEYMDYVREYYDQRELTEPVSERRVYLASDDEHALEDARNKYPSYTFVGDATIARAAATHRRYTPLSLAGLLVDLTLLSSTDFLVCTFSSQVGRLAYELMQGNRADASQSFFSLDDIYYFGGQNSHDRRAVLPHRTAVRNHIAFQAGDLIGVAGNHWNGYGRGRNKNNNQNGLIPWYKTTDHLVLYPFPEYKEVPLQRPAKIT